MLKCIHKMQYVDMVTTIENISTSVNLKNIMLRGRKPRLSGIQNEVQKHF